jgi:pimeloyl-ACP methyl ester carboxylesterase
MTSIVTESPSAEVRPVTSRDGTRIAYQRFGSGVPVILVGGALNDRKGKASGVPLAQLLEDRFTVYAYDRRGRGDSGFTPPYSVAREVEDLEALIADAGGSAALFGMSSGAVLVLEAAASGLNVTRLALFEPPFSMDAEAEARSRTYSQRLLESLAADDADGAVALFMGRIGMPQPAIEQMRKAPMWPGLMKFAASLAHDSAVMGDAEGATVPVERIGQISAPILVLVGEKSPPFMQQAAEAIVGAARHGSRTTLAGQTHDVAVDVLAPALVGFYSGE